jgi:hypothetical protein
MSLPNVHPQFALISKGQKDKKIMGTASSIEIAAVSTSVSGIPQWKSLKDAPGLVDYK